MRGEGRSDVKVSQKKRVGKGRSRGGASWREGRVAGREQDFVSVGWRKQIGEGGERRHYTDAKPTLSRHKTHAKPARNRR